MSSGSPYHVGVMVEGVGSRSGLPVSEGVEAIQPAGLSESVTTPVLLNEPTALVYGPVVPPTQQDQIVQLSGAAVDPVHKWCASSDHGACSPRTGSARPSRPTEQASKPSRRPSHHPARRRRLRPRARQGSPPWRHNRLVERTSVATAAGPRCRQQPPSSTLRCPARSRRRRGSPTLLACGRQVERRRTRRPCAAPPCSPWPWDPRLR